MINRRMKIWIDSAPLSVTNGIMFVDLSFKKQMYLEIGKDNKIRNNYLDKNYDREVIGMRIHRRLRKW